MSALHLQYGNKSKGKAAFKWNNLSCRLMNVSSGDSADLSSLHPSRAVCCQLCHDPVVLLVPLDRWTLRQ